MILRSKKAVVASKVRPFRCEVCGRCFGRKRGLNRHTSAVHMNKKCEEEEGLEKLHFLTAHQYVTAAPNDVDDGTDVRVDGVSVENGMDSGNDVANMKSSEEDGKMNQM